MKAMKIASILGGTVFVLYAILLLVQIWTTMIPWEEFMKLTVTAGILIVVIFGVAMLYREYMEEKTMKHEKYID